MKEKQKPNLIILAVVLILVGFGLLMITSAGAVVSQEKFNQSFYFVKNQILKGLIPGLALAALGYLVPYYYWRRLAKFIFIGGLVLLVLVYFPGVGLEFGGAKRWIGIAGLNFQPSELFKLCFVIYLAAFLEKAGSLAKNHQSQTLISFWVIMAIVGLLIGLQPDLGTLGVFALSGLAIYFLSRAPLRHIFVISGSALAAFLALIKIFPHAMQRVQVLFNPQLDPSGIGYQIDQSLIALGSGGMFGQGLAQGRQKFLYLPQPAGDSILAVIGEEFGFLGMIILSGLFVTFAFQGLKIAKNSPDQFARLLAGGLTFLIVIQAFINILAIIGLIPLTGVTLPFVSYGGSSLAISLMAVGILLNISKYSKT